MKIAIAGAGYVELSNAILLAQHNGDITLHIIAFKKKNSFFNLQILGSSL